MGWWKEKPSLTSRGRRRPQRVAQGALWPAAPPRLGDPSFRRRSPPLVASAQLHARRSVGSMAAASSGEKEKERPGGGLGAASGNSTRERLLSALEDLEVLSRWGRWPEALARAGPGGVSRDHRPVLGWFPGAQRGGPVPGGQCPSDVEVGLQPSMTRGQQPSLLFSRSVVSDSATPWSAAGRASPSFAIPRSWLRLTSI